MSNKQSNKPQQTPSKSQPPAKKGAPVQAVSAVWNPQNFVTDKVSYD